MIRQSAWRRAGDVRALLVTCLFPPLPELLAGTPRLRQPFDEPGRSVHGYPDASHAPFGVELRDEISLQVETIGDIGAAVGPARTIEPDVDHDLKRAGR